MTFLEQYPTFNSYRSAYPYLRWGQAFCNYYNLAADGIYYEQDDSKAKYLALTYYPDLFSET